MFIKENNDANEFLEIMLDSEHEILPEEYNRLGVLVYAPVGEKMFRVFKYPSQVFESLCGQCGQSAAWCEVYTGCPLNKGNAHKIYKKLVDKHRDS